jgi:hypothetical protein
MLTTFDEITGRILSPAPSVRTVVRSRGGVPHRRARPPPPHGNAAGVVETRRCAQRDVDAGPAANRSRHPMGRRKARKRVREGRTSALLVLHSPRATLPPHGNTWQLARRVQRPNTPRAYCRTVSSDVRLPDPRCPAERRNDGLVEA